MKRNFLVAVSVLGIIFGLSVAEAQRTTYFKFKVNGVEDTIMTQGIDNMAWECDCGVGDTLFAELYIDLNKDHILNVGDRTWIMGNMPVIDGNTNWNNGPADSSATPEGIFYCNLPPNFAMAPTYYIMKVMNLKDSSTAEDWVIITPHPSPAITVSGTVGIEGMTPPNMMLFGLWVGTNMEVDPAWWSTITIDSLGNYTLNLPDTGTWHIAPADNIAPYVRPAEKTLHITKDTTGVDFLYTMPEAFVYGDIKDERDSLVLRNFNIYLETESSVISETFTNTGQYLLGASAGSDYRLAMHEEEVWPDYLKPDLWNQTFSLTTGDSVQKDLYLIRTDTVIFGLVTENGGLPSQSYLIEASIDVGGYRWYIRSYSNSASGIFTLPVNGLISSYFVQVNVWDEPLPDGFGFESGNGWNVAPGDTVRVNLVSYKGSASGSLYVDPGDPAVDMENFSVVLQDTGSPWQDRGQAQVNADGSYKVYGPAGTWDLKSFGPNKWLIKPAAKRIGIDTVNVPGNIFLANYGHCVVSGYLHGVDSVSSNLGMGVDGDGGWPNGYNMYNALNDTSYSWHLCDGSWTLHAPWAPEWASVYYCPNDTSFVIGDSDSSINIDFYYVKVGIEDKPIKLVTALKSALPNPFNGKMIFQYSCAIPTKVELTIFDISGRTVKTLVNETRKAGYYTVNWDGKDNDNKLLPNGVYFCKFKALDVKKMQKLILVR